MMERLLTYIDRTNEWTGRIVSYLALFMMVSITYEVFARYFFSSPTLWVMEINQYALCIYVALAGGYAMLHNAHVNVEILYERFGPKTKALVNILTSVCFYGVVLTLLWKSGAMAWEAWEFGETSNSMLAFPLFPAKVAVPIGATLLLLQGTAKVCRDVLFLIRGGKDPRHHAGFSLLGGDKK